jgi:hypothetical protein
MPQTSSVETPKGANLAVRCHDVTSTLASKQIADFDQLVIIGMAVRLALHLQGASGEHRGSCGG